MIKRSYAYVVNSLTELADGFQQPIRQLLKPDEQTSLILVIPQHSQTRQKNWRYAPEQTLLFTAQSLLHVQKLLHSDPLPAAICLQADDVLFAHHSLLLLYGRLELAGVVNGSPVRIVVEYNTGDQALLQPALQQFLKVACGRPSRRVESGAEPAEVLLKKLDAQSFKFENGLRLYALQPGERLLGFVFQPCITEPKWRIFSHVIAPAALLVLTDREVIIIEEERAREASYGWLITFCPRRCIVSIETKPKKEWREVNVHLARNGATADRQVTLDNDKALAWEALWLSQNQAVKQNVTTPFQSG